MLNYCTVDGKDYIEYDIIEIDGNKYAYLLNEEDNSDYMIRKLVEDNYEVLKDENEFDLALTYFLKKHKDLIETEN